MSKKVITPVGTSLFANYFEKPRDSVTKTKYDTIERLSVDKWDERSFASCIDMVRNKVLPWAKEKIEKKPKPEIDASAEITSLLKILEEVQTDIDVYLIATETIVSRLASEILVGILDKFKNQAGHTLKMHFDPAQDVISGLQVTQKNRFQEIGLIELIKRIDSIVSGKYDKTTILNITGGFKAVIPYVTMLSQINNMSMYYIFQETPNRELSEREVIEIPQLPVDFDFSAIEENYVVFESLNKENQNLLPSPVEFKKDLHENGKKAEEEFSQLIQDRLIEINSNGKVRFSIFGQLLFKKYQSLYLSNKFHRQSLLSKLVELRVYEFFVKKYGAENVEQGKRVGKEVTDNGFDIDVYIQPEVNTIIGIEVKPGGNPPILKEKKGRESIEYKLTEGGFDYLLRKYEDKNVDLMVILYSHKDILHFTIEEIQKVHSTYPKETKNLGWYWLEVIPKYKTDTDWQVRRERLHHLYGKDVI